MIEIFQRAVAEVEYGVMTEAPFKCPALPADITPLDRLADPTIFPSDVVSLLHSYFNHDTSTLFF